MCLTDGRIRCAPLALAAWNLDDPSTWPAGRYTPESGWPKLRPNLYDLPSLQSIVEQIGGGALAPTHPAGQPWTPQIPMTRVILPSAPGTEWTPPSDGHLDGYATGWGGGFMAFFVVLFWDVSSPMGGGTGLLAEGRTWRTTDISLSIPSKIDGSYLFTEPVKSGGHRAILERDPSVGEVVCMTGQAGDAMLLHGLTTHVGSANAAGSRQPRVAQFARLLTQGNARAGTHGHVSRQGWHAMVAPEAITARVRRQHPDRLSTAGASRPEA